MSLKLLILRHQIDIQDPHMLNLIEDVSRIQGTVEIYLKSFFAVTVMNGSSRLKIVNNVTKFGRPV